MGGHAGSWGRNAGVAGLVSGTFQADKAWLGVRALGLALSPTTTGCVTPASGLPSLSLRSLVDGVGVVSGPPP